MIIKTLRIIALIIAILFVWMMFSFDYNKTDCYLHADNQSDCTAENNYKYKQ